ncbi:MAG: HPr family phosphocarrier protein [Coprococcus catus]|nr:HPr family phosphocarrier protein [Coprococcus catus]
MVERKVKVAIPCGMHIRLAGIISHTANGFKADSRIIFGYHVINTASILNLVASGIQCGDIVSVECDGPDEQTALDGIATVLQDSTLKQ